MTIEHAVLSTALERISGDTPLDEFVNTCALAAELNDWHHDMPDPGDYSAHVQWVLSKLMLTVTEISEAVEHLRSGSLVSDVWHEENGKPDGFAVEIGDALIRLFDLYGTLQHAGWDLPVLSEVLEEKLSYNASRGARHGGKVA